VNRYLWENLFGDRNSCNSKFTQIAAQLVESAARVRLLLAFVVYSWLFSPLDLAQVSVDCGQGTQTQRNRKPPIELIQNALFVRFAVAPVLQAAMIDSADAVVLAAITAVWIFAWQLFLAAVQQLQAVFKQRELRQIARRKRKERDEKRHSCLSDKPVDQRVVAVTRSSKSATKLQEGFARGEYNVQQLVAAYAHRCFTEGRQLEAVTEEFYDEAYARAGELDAEAKHTEIKELIRQRPLWGVPISVKDQIDQDGADSTCGVAARCFKPRKDGYVVKSLRQAGAIPFVRSNVPQLLMLPESENFIWGVAKNPWDPKRTPGGSSGGEGALVALGTTLDSFVYFLQLIHSSPRPPIPHTFVNQAALRSVWARTLAARSAFQHLSAASLDSSPPRAAPRFVAKRFPALATEAARLRFRPLPAHWRGPPTTWCSC
jgi:hypothetical protein